MRSERPLCLIGMSGVGKSFWAKRLAASGYVRHDCDGLIAARLGRELVVEPGEDPVHAVGRWMGMPWTDGYRERQARYLALEREVTETALRAVAAPGPHVIDSTGSVIYLDAALLSALRERCLVVYLRFDARRRNDLLRRFNAAPKPLIWGELFAPRAGESRQTALSRCYAELLAWRDARYLALGHLVVDATDLARRCEDAQAFLAELERALRARP